MKKIVKIKLTKEQMDFVTFLKKESGHKNYSETINMLINDFFELLLMSTQESPEFS